MQETKAFTNVVIYLVNELMGNVQRVDAKEARVTTGVRYAQYTDAVQVEWIEPRKRNWSRIILTFQPFIFVLTKAAAVPQPSSLVPESNGCMRSKYPSHDARYISDFLATLKQAGAKPLFAMKDGVFFSPESGLDLAEIEAALDLAQRAQQAYWDAKRDLEKALGGVEIDGADLSHFDVESIVEAFSAATTG